MGRRWGGAHGRRPPPAGLQPVLPAALPAPAGPGQGEARTEKSSEQVSVRPGSPGPNRHSVSRCRKRRQSRLTACGRETALGPGQGDPAPRRRLLCSQSAWGPALPRVSASWDGPSTLRPPRSPPHGAVGVSSPTPPIPVGPTAPQSCPAYLDLLAAQGDLGDVALPEGREADLELCLQHLPVAGEHGRPAAPGHEEPVLAHVGHQLVHLLRRVPGPGAPARAGVRACTARPMPLPGPGAAGGLTPGPAAPGACWGRCPPGSGTAALAAPAGNGGCRDTWRGEGVREPAPPHRGTARYHTGPAPSHREAARPPAAARSVPSSVCPRPAMARLCPAGTGAGRSGAPGDITEGRRGRDRPLRPLPTGRTQRHRAGTPGGTEAREGRDPPRGRTPWTPRGAGGDAPERESGRTWGLRTLLLGWGSAPCQGGLGGTGGQDQHRDTHGGRSLFTVIQGGPGTSAGSALWPEEPLR